MAFSLWLLSLSWQLPQNGPPQPIVQRAGVVVASIPSCVTAEAAAQIVEPAARSMHAAETRTILARTILKPPTPFDRCHRVSVALTLVVAP